MANLTRFAARFKPDSRDIGLRADSHTAYDGVFVTVVNTVRGTDIGTDYDVVVFDTDDAEFLLAELRNDPSYLGHRGGETE